MRKPQSKAQPPKMLQAQPAGAAAGKGGAARPVPPYKRCPSVTSLSDSTCSGESDQSMVSAAGSHAALQHRPGQQQQHGAAARPAKPAQLPGPPAPVKPCTAASALADSKQACMPDLPAANGAQQPRQQLHTWAGKVAGAQARCDAEPSTDAVSRQGSAAQLPGGSASAAQGAAGPQSTMAPCQEHVQQQASAACSAAELAAARAAVQDAAREKAALAAEVARLRAALERSEAARQHEVARLLQTAAQHEAQVMG